MYETAVSTWLIRTLIIGNHVQSREWWPYKAGTGQYKNKRTHSYWVEEKNISALFIAL